MKYVSITIAGFCYVNDGPGAWACILRHGDSFSERVGGSPCTTMRAMELQAVIEGLQALREPCHVFLNSDNEYLLNGIPFRPDEWRLARFAQLWKRVPDRLPDRDLWMKLDPIASTHRIQRQYITGTFVHPDKKQCDKLAEAHAAQFLGVSSLAALLD